MSTSTPAVSSIRNGLPSTEIPIDITTFALYVIPAFGCYILAAVLAVTPGTRLFRIALWPIVTLFAIRAISVDLSCGDPKLKWLNITYVHAMISIPVHTLFWASAKKPPVRHLRPTNSSLSTIMDALDLVTNLRGIGWDWSSGLYIARETRPTSRIAFGFYALFSAFAHLLIICALRFSIQTFITGSASSLHGSSVFDQSLPAFVRCLRSSIIATLAAFATYIGQQMAYDVCTVLGILLGQDPAQWPPAFDRPWRATSLSEFWSRRWHQTFRHTFLLSSYPFTLVLGRAGTLIGAFLASGFAHYMMMTTLDSQTEMWRMVVSFGMMAPGIFAERTFYRLTRRKVGGVAGWVWMMAWLMLWGSVMVDGFARAGLFLCPMELPSMRAPIEKSVISFDAWLHTL